MRLSKPSILVIAVLVIALISIATFASTTGQGNVVITAGSSLPGGGLADITALSDPFTVFQGNAQKISGLELHRIDLASSAIADQIRVQISLINAENMSQVLSNPYSWVEISIVYQVSSGQNFTLSTGEKVKIASLRVDADNHMTREHGSITLLPEMGGDSIDTDTYWVLGSVTIPGGAPPGQQNQLGVLNIHVDVRK